MPCRNRCSVELLTEVLTGGGPTSDAAGKFSVPRVPTGKGSLIVMPKDGGFQSLAKRDFEVTTGQRLDVGTGRPCSNPARSRSASRSSWG